MAEGGATAASATRRGIGICWAIKKPITFKYSGDSGKVFHIRSSAKLGNKDTPRSTPIISCDAVDEEDEEDV